MRLRLGCGLLAAFVLVDVAAQTPETTFRAGVDFVLVDVSVRQRGRPVADLRLGDFAITDGGVEQQLADVSREVLPVDVTLVVDWSGSVFGGVLASLTRAMAAVRSRLRPEDRASVVTFNHRIRDLGAVPDISVETLGRPTGLTSLIDAVAVSLIRTREPGRRPMTILFTDGIDTTSFLEESTLLDVARRTDAAVFIVALSQAPGARRDNLPYNHLFETLAETTGGAFVLVRADEDLGRSFVAAFDEFRESYMLRYAYQGPERPGWHPLTVRVTRRGSFEVRARPGYFRTGP